MVKNLKGGKYAKKQKNKNAERARAEQPDPEEGQEWAMVLRMLGQCRVMLLLSTGKEMMGVIRGTMRKRVYIRPGDIVLVTERETAEEKGDVVFKYDEQYIGWLRKAEPKLPFWKAAYQLHAGGAEEEGGEDDLVNFVEGDGAEDPEDSDAEDGDSDEEGSEAASEEIDIDAI